MTLTTHAIVGAAITNLVPANPELGFALAFASHYLSDIIPHAELVPEDSIIEKSEAGNSFDKNNLKSVFHDAKSSFGFLLIGLDFIIAVILCMIIFARDEKTLFLTILGIIGGLLPDFLQFLYYKIRKGPFIFFQKIHHFFHSLGEPVQSGNMKETAFAYLSPIILPVLFIAIYFLVK